MSDFFYEKWGSYVHVARRNDMPFPMHLHRQIELLSVTEGCVTMQVGKNRYDVHAGETGVIFPHQIHGYLDTGTAHWCYFTIFPPDALDALGGGFSSLVPETPIVSPTPPAVLSCFQTLYETSCAKGPFCAQKLNALTVLLLAELLPHLTLRVGPATDTERMADVLTFCNQHFREPLSLNRLCDELHVSATYVTHVLREYLGMTFLTYLTSLRVAEAKRLLKDKSRSITDVALETGFQTIRTFNRAFLTSTGQTPSDYRKMSKE